MSEVKLKSCPFCCGKAKIIENNYHIDTYSVMCKNCFSETDRYHKQEEAITQWNTRKPIEKIVRELEKPYNNTVMAGKCFTTVDRAIEIIERGEVNDD